MFGGLLTEIGWRWVFFLPVPMALLTLLAAIRLVPDPGQRPRARRLVRPGRRGDADRGMLLLVFTVVEAPDAGWASVRTLGSFAGAAAILGAFVVIERGPPRRSCGWASCARPRWCRRTSAR